MSKSEKDPEMQKMVEAPPSENVNSKEKSSNAAKAVSACALYSFCSVSMVLVNKSLASR